MGGNSGFGSAGRGQSNDIALYWRDATAGSAWQEATCGEDGGRFMKKTVLGLLKDKDTTISSIAGNYDSTSLKSILQGPGHGIVTTVGKGDTMPKGTIVFPMQFCGTTTATVRDFALYSKDGGDTWAVTKLLPSETGSGTSEPCIAELDDGSWLMMVRSAGTATRRFYRTTDFSDWTYCENNPGHTFEGAPGTQGSILKIGTNKTSHKSVYACCHCTTGSGYVRSGLLVYFGTDETATYPNDCTHGVAWNTTDTVMLFKDATGEKAYNSMIMVDENTLGILYEANDHIYYDAIDVSAYLK